MRAGRGRPVDAAIAPALQMAEVVVAATTVRRPALIGGRVAVAGTTRPQVRRRDGTVHLKGTDARVPHDQAALERLEPADVVVGAHLLRRRQTERSAHPLHPGVGLVDPLRHDASARRARPDDRAERPVRVHELRPRPSHTGRFRQEAWRAPLGTAELAPASADGAGEARRRRRLLRVGPRVGAVVRQEDDVAGDVGAIVARRRCGHADRPCRPAVRRSWRTHRHRLEISCDRRAQGRAAKSPNGALAV